MSRSNPTAGIRDRDLDEQIAVADARCRVASAHGLSETAGHWHEVVLCLDEIRRGRAAVLEAAADALNPVTVADDPDGGGVI